MVLLSGIFTNLSLKPSLLPLASDEVAAWKPGAAFDCTHFRPNHAGLYLTAAGDTLPPSRKPSCYLMGWAVSVEWRTCRVFMWVSSVCADVSSPPQENWTWPQGHAGAPASSDRKGHESYLWSERSLCYAAVEPHLTFSKSGQTAVWAP